MQQGDPDGSHLFSLVIHPVITGIENACESLFFNKWQLEIKAFVKTSYHQPSGLLISCNCRNYSFCSCKILEEDPQIALTLLRQCAAFTHIARTTPPNLIQSALATFDDNVRACNCFMECTAIDLSPNCPAWKQAR